MNASHPPNRWSLSSKSYRGIINSAQSTNRLVRRSEEFNSPSKHVGIVAFFVSEYSFSYFNCLPSHGKVFLKEKKNNGINKL